MKRLTVFFSWQSDKPENKRILRKNIDKAIKVLSQENQFACYSIERDEATRHEAGSPNIVETLHQKINQCAVFVADVSPIFITNEGEGYPNPNVLLEEGFALRAVGYERIILVSDAKPETLPFDISQRRITPLESDMLDPIRKAIVVAIEHGTLEYDRNALTHDSEIYHRFEDIIKNEQYLLDILHSIPSNLRISRYDNNVLEKITEWHKSGDGKYLNADISEAANILNDTIDTLLHEMSINVRDNLDQSNLCECSSNEEQIEASKYHYWYFKKVSGTNSYEEDQVVWDTQEKLYTVTELVIKAYTYYRDNIRKVLFI